MRCIGQIRNPRRFGAMVLLCHCPMILVAHTQAQQPETDAPPRVVSAPNPAYPKIALAARVSGIVRLHVTTNGTRVSLIDREDGPPMLIKSAKEYLQTWTFGAGAPTSFDVTFEYKLLDARGCQEVDRGVVLDLPTYVEIRDAPFTCDWERFQRQKTYLREQRAYPVELHLSVDGKSITDPAEIQISDGKRVITLPVKDGVFAVPEEFEASPSLSFEAVVGAEEVVIGGINGSALKEAWEIDLPKSVHQGWKARLRGLDGHHSCVVSFEPLDGDGMGMVVTPCRRRLGS